MRNDRTYINEPYMQQSRHDDGRMTKEQAVKWVKFVHDVLYEDKDEEIREALDMAIEALQEVQKHEETFEWCTDCKEYDKDNYCCHRWSKMIRNTVEELKEFSGLVRCKDCRWQEECSQFVVLHKFCGVYQEISFCSYGEKEDE